MSKFIIVSNLESDEEIFINIEKILSYRKVTVLRDSPNPPSAQREMVVTRIQLGDQHYIDARQPVDTITGKIRDAKN